MAYFSLWTLLSANLPTFCTTAGIRAHHFLLSCRIANPVPWLPFPVGIAIVLQQIKKHRFQCSKRVQADLISHWKYIFSCFAFAPSRLQFLKVECLGVFFFSGEKSTEDNARKRLKTTQLTRITTPWCCGGKIATEKEKRNCNQTRYNSSIANHVSNWNSIQDSFWEETHYLLCYYVTVSATIVGKVWIILSLLLSPCFPSNRLNFHLCAGS